MNYSEAVHFDGPSARWFDVANESLQPYLLELWTGTTPNTSSIPTTSTIPEHPSAPCSDETKFFLFSEVERFTLLLAGASISVVAVVLNCLVLACFAAYPTLRSPSNIYVVHLAICDLFVGFNSLPSRVIIDFVGCWPLPLLCCRISQVLHWITVQQSAFCMVMIAYDRYLMLHLGSAYAARETTTTVWRRIMLFWVLNTLIWTPLNLMHLFTQTSASSPGLCNTEFLSNAYVAMPMFVWANFVTPGLLLFVYSLVFAALRRRTQRQLLNHSRPSVAVHDQLPVAVISSPLQPPQPPPVNTLTAVNMAATMLLSPYSTNNGDCTVGGAAAAHRPSMSSMTPQRAQQMTRTERLLARQKRALRSMIVLTAVFLLTWLPEGILGITYKAYCSLKQCYGENVDPEAFQVYYSFVKATSLADYFLLANAALNPALYALAFPSIREAMMRLTLPKRLYLHWLSVQRNKHQRRKEPPEVTLNHIVSAGAAISRHQTNLDGAVSPLLNHNKKFNIDSVKLSNGGTAPNKLRSVDDQEEASHFVDDDDDEGGTLTAVRRDKTSVTGSLFTNASSKRRASERGRKCQRRLSSMRLHSHTQQYRQSNLSDSGVVNGGGSSEHTSSNVDELQTTMLRRRNSEHNGTCVRAWNNSFSPLLDARTPLSPSGDAKVAAMSTTNDIDFTIV